MDEWEKAQRMSAAVRAVDVLDKASKLTPEERFQKALSLAKAGEDAISAILTQSNQSINTNVELYPPGTREPPLQKVSGGIYDGMTYEQVKQDMEKRLTEVGRENPKQLHTWWHDSRLPIGYTREIAFGETRYRLGKPSAT
jgi:hypothetical protein